MPLFLSRVFSWTHSSYELRPSTRVPGTYDQPEAACTWLRIFRTHNSNFITEVELSLTHLPSPPSLSLSLSHTAAETI